MFFSACNLSKPEAAPLIPLKDFFKNPERTSYKISPDGKFFSYKAPYQNRMNIFVQEIGQDSAVRLTSETDRDIAGYFWANDGRILYLKDTGGDENFRLYGVNVDGSNLICFTDFPGVLTQVIDDLEDIPDEVIIALNKRVPEVFDAYRLNIVSGKMEMIAENPGNIQGWITDHDGKLRAATAIAEDGISNQLLYRETENDPFKVVITTSFKDQVGPQFFTFDNKNMYVSTNLGRDKAVIAEFDLATGKEIKVLYENKDFDVDGLSYSRKRKVLTTASYESWKNEKYFFDETSQKIYERLAKDLGNYEIAITGLNRNEDRFIIRTYSDRSLGAYYIYDSNTDKLDKIAEVSPWMNEDDMATQSPIQYTTRDGLTVHGYLTLPKGYTIETAHNLPVVINPHGGPWARDSWGFNPEIQFLANRGYAVLQMNFRGSTGYGKAFWTASFKQWGLTMQDDITDGVKWLIDKKIADPARIAIYGGSYGGYATLQGIVKDPDQYAAAIDYVGVSNLFSFMETIPPYWKPFLDMMYEMVGNPKQDSLQLAQTSPALNADKIKTPLFIAQGANDPRVNKAESDQVVEALKARGVEVEYMVKDNEGHGFHNEENQFEFYGAMETFLATHLKKEAK
ncbi:MAG: S9 family peptidase [Bacteroidales bacterium]|nr:S9 family peptidase [Bacteroidales bacterium]